MSYLQHEKQDGMLYSTLKISSEDEFLYFILNPILLILIGWKKMERQQTFGQLTYYR